MGCLFMNLNCFSVLNSTVVAVLRGLNAVNT